VVKDATLQKIIILNPMAQAIQDARYLLVTPQTLTISKIFGTPLARLIPLTFCLIVLIVGVLYFRKQSKLFAENL
jgi:ABC-2 type transport system permease protein